MTTTTIDLNILRKETLMSTVPFLSIIVPVYNTEPYLERCIDSILAQNYQDYELILVDDGSTDNSPAICDRYAADHAQIVCLHQPNGGHTSARQKGVRASHGSYITFVDSDDWIAPAMYGNMCRAAISTGADIVHCNMTAVMPHKEELRDVPFAPGYYDKEALLQTVYPRMIYTGVYFKFGIAPGMVNKLFRRELLEKYLFRIPHDIIVGEDGPVTYGCMLEASSVYFCEESYYFYRSNPGSLCHHMDAGRLKENHTMFDTYAKVMDTTAFPGIGRQLHYFYVYQSLLTYVPVFRTLLNKDSFCEPDLSPEDSRTAKKDDLQNCRNIKDIFLAECDNPHVKEAFASVPIQDIKGTHNRLCAFCIRHRLYGLFKVLLKH